MSNKLQQAVDAINLGDKSRGQKILTEVLKSEPQNEDAWLWMSKIVTNVEQKKQCLEQVLSLNPSNKEAQQELEQLQQINLKPVIQNIKTDDVVQNTHQLRIKNEALAPLKKISKRQDNNQNQLSQEQIQILSELNGRADQIEKLLASQVDFLSEVVTKQDEQNKYLEKLQNTFSSASIGCGLTVIILMLAIMGFSLVGYLSEIISMMQKMRVY
ncbi:MAG: hypothetical protein KDJ52_17625 [Anaerolineae bacterium]|nr:hypothetical protein [Anaerolineae bacterium]